MIQFSRQQKGKFLTVTLENCFSGSTPEHTSQGEARFEVSEGDPFTCRTLALLPQLARDKSSAVRGIRWKKFFKNHPDHHLCSPQTRLADSMMAVILRSVQGKPPWAPLSGSAA